MTLVLGTDCAVARALADAAPAADPAVAVAAVADRRPARIAIIALPASVGPIGALPTETLAELVDATVTLALGVTREAAGLGSPVRIAIVCPADAVHPDHLDGARSVIGAGLTMLVEVAAALPTITINAIAVADDVPAEEVAALTRFVLSGETPSLNGTTIRLDGGRDAVLAAQTRAEGD
jgi:hypothetical protein